MSIGRHADRSGPTPPLAPRQFKWFMRFWHVFLLGGLGGTLAVAWSQAADTGNSRMLVVTGMVAVQAGVYLRTFGRFQRVTVPGYWWAVHFGVSLGLWCVEVFLEPRFAWLLGPYLGQLMGAVRPRYSLPLCLVFIFGWITWGVGWTRIAALNPWMLACAAAAVGSWIGLALFLHKLAVTSTERGRLIEELEAARKQLEAARDREAELAVLRERERVARDLHDSLGHGLSTLSVQLEAVQRLYPVDPKRGALLLEDMKKLTRSSMEDLRRTLANLRSPGLGERLLVGTLKQWAEEIECRTGLRIQIELDPAGDTLQPRVMEALWRVGQEGLANVERHAQAESARVQLKLIPGHVELSIEDDGVGMPDHAESKPSHYGLRGARERIEGLGGNFAVQKGEQGGTRLLARIPVLN